MTSYHRPMRRPSAHSPSVRRRRLAVELRKLREQTGLTGATAAKNLGWQHSKITRIERADQGITQPDLATLLDLYQAGDQAYRDGLMQLAKDAKQRGWWSDYRDVFGSGALPDFEAEASTIRTFEAQVITGLLQTPSYTEAIFRGGAAHPGNVVERHVQARLERQRILEGVYPAKLYAIIDEGALRREVGGAEVMREQLQHLINSATRHNVDLRVLPFSAGAHAAMLGSFLILDFEDPLDQSLAFTESVTTSQFLEEPHQIERHNEVYGHLQGSALLPEPSVELIENVMRDNYA
ncbi:MULTISPECIES: helix-turn-helix domain-containing protein [Nocardiopsis]|uniref:Helix-turn-helix transcriptional regulator n=1 Tax=Nocardiopsis tropica TaxID=109330 RepID=A0ABU7KVC5_9ACTN|nr:helix-turn-helix transcriptional regulator [Nocardiopsis umidischolae]MEE2053032.1 helix-turn-helix transcriptional regulator [Nocardiopsis umidischolae]